MIIFWQFAIIMLVPVEKPEPSGIRLFIQHLAHLAEGKRELH